MFQLHLLNNFNVDKFNINYLVGGIANSVKYALTQSAKAQASAEYCVSNATSYYATLPNAEYGKWTSTTAYPSASANPFLCLVYDSSIYCFSKSYGYFAQVSPSSGIGTWQQISYPLLLNITSC